MARYFSRTHPAKGKYKGDGWLQKKKDEFKQRFGINFEADRIRFVRVEELVLARNAAIHRGNGTLKEYKQKVPEPRFLANDRLNVDKPLLMQSFEDVNNFVERVWADLKRIRSEGAQTSNTRPSPHKGR